MKIVSLFSGIGGFEAGIMETGLPYEIVFASEIDKYARISYSANFSSEPLHGDITKISEHTIPDHDCLVAGFPCQAFSIAGNQNGFNDTRGTLFFDVARILKAKQPKYIFLENVKNLVSHDHHRTIKVILRTLSNLGYSVDFTILNSKESGIPQNRERTYIVGILNGKTDPFTIDKRSKLVNKLKQEFNKFNLKSLLATSYDHKQDLSSGFDSSFNVDYGSDSNSDAEFNQTDQQSSNEFRSFNFFNSLVFNNPLQSIVDILAKQKVDNKYYLHGEKISNFIAQINSITSTTRINNHTDILVDIDKNPTIIPSLKSQQIIKLFDLPKEIHSDLERQRRVYDINGIAPTVLARSDSAKIYLETERAIRKLTVEENFYVQGFKVEFVNNIKATGMSTTQMYKQSGNAVSPPVITGIFKHLINF